MSSPSPSKVWMNSTGSVNSSVRSQTSVVGVSSEDYFQRGLQEFQTSLEYLINKNYMSGYIKKKNDLGPDKTPFIQRKWTEWYVELNGTTLMFWSVKSPSDCEPPRLDVIKKKNPNFINIADCNVYTTQIDEAPHAFILNSAGANRFFFQTLSEDELSIWILAIRLACFETSLLHERYTSLIINTDLYSPFQYEKRDSGSFGGFVEMRCSGMLEWCRFWMSIRADSEGQLTITFSSAKYNTDFLFVVNNLQQSYIVYPEQPDLIDQASVLRLDGEVRALRDPGVNQADPPFILVMASSQLEMITILFTLYDSFHLHGRPRNCFFVPMPESPSLYLDLPEIIAAPAIGVPFSETRRYLLDTSNQKFGILTASPTAEEEINEGGPEEPLVPEPIPEPEPEPEQETETEPEEPEENEFEPANSSFRVSTFGAGTRASIASAFAGTSTRPKIRKNVSFTWAEDETDGKGEAETEDKEVTDDPEPVLVNEENEVVVQEPVSEEHSSPKEQEKEEEEHRSVSPKVTPDVQPAAESTEPTISKSSSPAKSGSDEDASPTLKQESARDIKRKSAIAQPAQDSSDSENSEESSSESDDDDDDDTDFLKIRVAKPTRPTRKVPAVPPKAAPVESSDEEETKQSSPELDAITKKTAKLGLDPMSAANDLRPTSVFQTGAHEKPKLQARPFSMAPAASGAKEPKEGANFTPTRRSAPRSKVSLPTASDSSSDEDTPNRPSQELRGPSGEGSSFVDDDAPIGATFGGPTDAYGNPLMRQSMYGGQPGQVEYGPDGMPYYPDPQAMGYPPYDPQAMGYPPYDPQAMGYPPYDPQAMPGFNAYNPALQRPSTLLEAQDFARYNDQLVMNQPRHGPLIQLAAKKTVKPSGGLVGAISALEQQRAANKYTNANARMSHVSHVDQERERNFERQKERYLAEQRAMASQSQIFPPDAHYGNYGPGMDPMAMQGGPAGNHLSPMAQPLRARSPYGNNGASLSAGSFYHPGQNNMMPGGANQGQYGMGGYPQMMPPHGMGPGNPYYPQDHPQDESGYSGFPRSYSQGDLYGDPYHQQMHGGPAPDDNEDDDKPVGLALNNKAMSTNPMLAKGRYREHTVSQLKVNKDDDEDDSESEPEIDDDVQESFEEFVDGRLQMKPYAFAALDKVFQAFVDHCQDADLDAEDIPDAKTFSYMMGQAGFVSKKRSPTGEEMWYNIAIIDG